MIRVKKNNVANSTMAINKMRATAGDQNAQRFLNVVGSTSSLRTQAFGKSTIAHSFSSLKNSIDDMTVTDDYMYVRAELLIELLANGSLIISRLTLEQKIILFSYFYKYDKKMGRIIDLFVELPLSSMRLQKPANATNDILQDYIFDFFKRMWDSKDFKNKLKGLFLNTKLFGVGAILISDDYNLDSDTILDFNNLDSIVQDEVEEEEWEFIKETTSLYNDKPNEVPYKDKSKVISKLIKSINKDYKGVKFTKIIDPFIVAKRLSNLDIDYHSYSLKPNANISKFLTSPMAKGKNTDEIVTMLANLGYSKSYVKLFVDSKISNVTIDSNPFYNNGCYIIAMEGSGLSINDKSSFNRVLQSAIDLKVIRDRERFKAQQAYKVNRIVSVADGSIGTEEMDSLEAKIISSVSNPEGTLLVTNYDVQWQEFSMDAREQVELSGYEEKAERDIYSSFGMPDALIGGDDSYANSFMKMEMMTNEFQSTRMQLKQFVEDKLFKPIAIKKGFVITDDWGNPSVVFPSLKFDRITIARGTEDFSLLQDLAMSNKIPWKTLIEALNFDFEEVQSELKREKLSMVNDNMGAVIDNALGEMSDKLLESEDFTKKVADVLGIKEVEEIADEPKDEGEEETPNENNEETSSNEDEVEAENENESNPIQTKESVEVEEEEN